MITIFGFGGLSTFPGAGKRDGGSRQVEAGGIWGRQLTCVKTAAFSLKKWDPEL